MAELSAIETHDSVAACAVTEMFASALYMALHGLEKQNIANYATRFVDGGEYGDFWFDNMDDLINRPFKKTAYALSRSWWVYLADELVEIADKLLKMDKCPIIRTRFEGENFIK